MRASKLAAAARRSPLSSRLNIVCPTDTTLPEGFEIIAGPTNDSFLPYRVFVSRIPRRADTGGAAALLQWL